MKKSKLLKEERDMLRSVENGGYVSELTEQRRAEFAQFASDTFKKDRRINIRISNRDLLAVQSKASQEGIPYQTLVSSIIHKYVSGSLRDVTQNED